MPLQRSQAEILGAFGDALKNDFRKCLPATVTGVHPDRQTVDVDVAVHNILFDDLGNTYEEPTMQLADVPLGVLRGGGFFVWVPVTVGDSVLLVFSDLSADTWRAGDGSPRAPGWVGKHTADSPFAIPMFAPDAKFLQDPQTDAGKVIIGQDGSAAQIRISATDIELGNSPTDALGLASKIDAAVTTIVQAFNNHTHQVAAFGTPGGPPLSIAPPGPGTITPPASVASTLIKAQ